MLINPFQQEFLQLLQLFFALLREVDDALIGSANFIGNIVKNYFATAEAQGKGEDYVPMLSDHVAALNGISLTGGAPTHGPVRKVGGG